MGATLGATDKKRIKSLCSTAAKGQTRAARGVCQDYIASSSRLQQLGVMGALPRPADPSAPPDAGMDTDDGAHPTQFMADLDRHPPPADSHHVLAPLMHTALEELNTHSHASRW